MYFVHNNIMGKHLTFCWKRGELFILSRIYCIVRDGVQISAWHFQVIRDKNIVGKTLSVKTLSVKTLSVKTLSVKTLSVKTLSVKSLSVKTFVGKNFRR